MRGMDHQQSGMFSYISAERRVPKDHPLRAIRVMVDAALKESSWRFDALYASSGRPSIAPDTMAPQNRSCFRIRRRQTRAGIERLTTAIDAHIHPSKNLRCPIDRPKGNRSGWRVA